MSQSQRADQGGNPDGERWQQRDYAERDQEWYGAPPEIYHKNASCGIVPAVRNV